MAQIGVTAFALMFAAVQFRWGLTSVSREKQWSSSRLGKLSATTALLELLTITLVSAAYLVTKDGHWAWRVVALACAVAGYSTTILHLLELRRARLSGYLLTPADRMQKNAGWLPFISYGLLAACAIFASSPKAEQSGGPLPASEVVSLWAVDDWLQNAMGPSLDTVLAWVLCWFLISGLFETFVTLSPNLLEPELEHLLGSVRMPSGMNCAHFGPDGDQRGCAIVLLPEVWGATTDMKLAASRLATLGHEVLVVDYYSPSLRSRTRKVGTLISPSPSVLRHADLGLEARRWFLNHGRRDIVAVGFSIGGTAALSTPHAWAAIAAFYPHAPETLAPLRTGPPAFIASGTRDFWDVQRDAKRIAAMSAPGSVWRIYHDARHGFMGTSRGAWWFVRFAYVAHLGPAPAQAEQAWADLQAFLIARVRPDPTVRKHSKTELGQGRRHRSDGERPSTPQSRLWRTSWP